MWAELAAVTVESADLDRVANVYRRVCGIEPTVSPGDGRLRFDLGDASLWLVAGRRDGGVVGVTLGVPDPGARAQALRSAGIDFGEGASGLEVSAPQANGLQVLLRPARDDGPRAAAARLDHVAIRVRDLRAAMDRWAAISGVEAFDMGVHPVSNGAFTAARFILGERMIELVAPVPGVASPMADRLSSHGEGAAVLALPVDDLGLVRRALEATGARVLRQPPHWMVHPKDAGGVLLQLTPRVAH